jgi:uncharacterized protein (TIGR02611 family)
MLRKTAEITYRVARRVVVSLVGVTVILIGVVMLVTPGPGTLVIPLGLAILGLEFAWARRWLRAIRERGKEALTRVRGSGDGPMNAQS